MKKLALIAAIALAVNPAVAQDNAITLNGAIDIHAHQDPDEQGRIIEADDVARQAKERGMRAVVLKNHFESTAALAYMVRKMVPGIEVFGGIALDRAVGGVNVEAVRHMAAMKGGYGRVVWLPTFDSANQVKGKGPQVEVAKDGKLLPETVAVIDFIAKHPPLLLETGHISAEEALLVAREAKARGVKHFVATHGMGGPTNLTIAQAKEFASLGGHIEFVYGSVPNYPDVMPKFIEQIRAIGPAHCIISSDLGGTRTFFRPLPAQGMLDFMNELRKAGFTVAEINMMAKTNPAKVLSLDP